MQTVNTRGGEKSKKGWLGGVFLVLVWIMIIPLWKDVWEVKGGFSRIEDSKKRLQSEEAKNAELKRKLEAVQTRDYKEKLIREKLNMQKPGEVVVVLSGAFGGVDQASGSAEGGSSSERNWDKWWKLIR